MCVHPINIRNPKVSARSAEPHMQVPCGRCMACKQRHARQWSFRLYHQNKVSKSGYFVTLTYENEHLPVTQDNVFPELCKHDLSGFMKKLRRQSEYHTPHMGEMKYYAVGEYGGQTGRPHYHAIIFNLDTKIKDKIKDIWKKGNVHIDTINMDTISYVTGYVMKRDVDKSKDLNRQIEFSLMSKGLGLSYFNNNKKYHVENETYIAKFQGTDLALPTYYKKKMFSETQRDKISGELKIKLEEDHLQKLEKLTKKGIQNPEAYIKNQQYGKIRSIQKRLKKDKF